MAYSAVVRCDECKREYLVCQECMDRRVCPQCEVCEFCGADSDALEYTQCSSCGRKFRVCPNCLTDMCPECAAGEVNEYANE